MKHKKILIAAGAVVLAVLLAGYVWWHLPTGFLQNVEPADVAQIEVFNGSTGQRFVIEEDADIEYIVRKIADVKMRKREYSRVDGFTYSLSFTAADGRILERFILNSADSIRDGNIAYEIALETEEDPLCFYYIRDLEAAQ